MPTPPAQPTPASPTPQAPATPVPAPLPAVPAPTGLASMTDAELERTNQTLMARRAEVLAYQRDVATELERRHRVRREAEAVEALEALRNPPPPPGSPEARAMADAEVQTITAADVQTLDVGDVEHAPAVLAPGPPPAKGKG